MLLSIELFIASLRDNEIVYSRSSFEISKASADTDDLVTDYIKVNFSPVINVDSGNYLLHSTSWRYDHNGRITLTYILYSDYLNLQTPDTKLLSLKKLVLAHSTNARRPRPGVITEENVLAHALRHLGFLVQTDKKDIFMKAMKQASYETFKKVFADLAGKLQ